VLVAAAEVARPEVMNIDMPRRAAARDDATHAIAPHHEPANLRCHVLGGGTGLLIRSDSLRVALRDLAIRLADRQVTAAAVLPCLLTAEANGRQDLVTGAAPIVSGRAAVEDRIA
jgi:hypothetical protein